MILRANAALSRRQRERLVGLVGAGVTIAAAALVVGCSRQTASKWVGRHRRGEGLGDRSSRPHRSPRRTAAALEQAVLRARRELRLGPHQLGWALGLASSTVYAILRRHGSSRRRPPLPACGDRPLRARPPGRARARRRQEARAHRRPRPSRHRRPPPAHARGRLAVRLRRDRRGPPPLPWTAGGQAACCSSSSFIFS